MHRIRQMKIGTRMACAFGLVILLLLMMLAFALHSLFSMSALVDGFYFDPFRTVNLVQSINGDIQGIGKNILEALATVDKAASARAMDAAASQRSRVTESLQELRQIETDREMDARLLALSQSINQLFLAQTNIVHSIQQGDKETAKDHYVGSFVKVSEEARMQALSICGVAEQSGYLYMTQSNEDALRNATVLGLVTLAAVLLAVLVTAWIVRSITAPVMELKTFADAVSHGDLHSTSSYASSDELGELAASMRRSVANLSAYIGEIDHSLTSLGQGDLDYRAEDIFEGDFVAIKEAIDRVALLLRAQRTLDERQRQALKGAYEEANQANRAKSDFLSRMSHDIRTPMNAIIGMTAIATTSLDDREKVSQCLKKISLSSKHLLGLINDVLDMSKIESGQMTLSGDSMSLPEVMENIVNITQPQIKAKHQNFSIRLHGIEHERLFCDSLRINQVFINILSNAVKFTPVGGNISIDVTELPSQMPGHAHYTFAFADSGKGMKPEFMRQIFSAFVREGDGSVDNIEGTGLGMAISKKIVDLMGGDIRVQSEVGKGSCFTVDLHLRLADTEPDEMLLPDIRVLVVDDDVVVCQTATRALEEIGMSAEWVDNGEEAIRRAEVAIKRSDPYHAIILDWQMPGMDGIACARAIRRTVGPNVPILIISAYDWSDIEDEARSAGIDGFIAKPLFKSTLYYGLRRFVLGEDAEGEAPDPSAVPSLAERRILLVEDNELNREIALELLGISGVAVECAENGAEAVTLFGERPERYYDMILMDVQMPVMDGYEATRIIRRMEREDAQQVPILAMTANAFSEDVQEAHRAGMNHHLAKPLDPARMLREIARFM